MRRIVGGDIPGKSRRGRPNLRGKDACKRDMTKAGLKGDNTKNKAAWRKEINSYNGYPQMTGQPRGGEEGHLGIIKLGTCKHISLKDVVLVSDSTK